SSGIGRAIALQLAVDGLPVVLADIRRDPLTGGEPTDVQIGRRGGECEFVQADVSSAEACENLVGLAATHFGRLDVLVNNAVLAGPHSKPLVDPLDPDWDPMMAVHLPPPFLPSPPPLPPS